MTAAAQPIRPAPAFKGDALVAAPTANWPTNGGNWYNQRYSPLTKIDRSNVANLKGVWRTRLRGSGIGTKYSGEAQPIVYDGVVYVVTGADDVFALGVESGEILWSYAANLDASNDVVCCGWTSRGVGLGDGKVFVGQLDGKLVALDQKTGKVEWSVQAERWQDGLTITSAPLYFDGLVITGFAGAEYGIRGRVKAFDARSGKLVWTFYTVPGPGEFGHDTWPQDNDLWMHGGASVWQTPAVDPELGLIFFSTGNPGPDYNGGVRAGDNLFSASIVALDAKTGEYRWHFQQVHHDIWDYDGPSPVVLFDLELNGAQRKGIAQPSKTGWVYILDRTNGTPLIGIDERPVPQEPRQATAATQPYPRGDAFVPQSIAVAPEGFALVNGGKIFTPFWTDREVPVKPSFGGGANWPPSSYDPSSGYLIRLRAGSRRRVQGRSALGATAADRRALCRRHLRRVGPAELRRLRGARHAHEHARLATTMGRRVLQRLDDDGRRPHVRRPQRRPAHGARFAQRPEALGIPNGRRHERARQRVRARRQAIRRRLLGRQFVRGLAERRQRLAVRLDGTLPPAPPPGAAMLFTREAEGTADPAAGKVVYETACVFCHGEQGEGGHGGGKALKDAVNADVIVQTVSEGRNAMPPLGTALTPEQIRDVAAYVATMLPH